MATAIGNRTQKECIPQLEEPYDLRAGSDMAKYDVDASAVRQPLGLAPTKNITLKPADEEARRNAPDTQGYCVDELCSCDKHHCVSSRKTLPFEGYTTYRTEYVNKHIPGDARKELSESSVPEGVDPAAWKEYLARNGLTTTAEVPAWMYYKPTKDNRDFSTENRAEYTSKMAGQGGNGYAAIFGPDGVPIGVDPKIWHDYVAKHGLPKPGQIPSYLYFKPSAETRDFSTEHRTVYGPKFVAGDRDSLADCMYGPDGVPDGVDPRAWKEYVAKNGVPSRGNIPSHLFFRPTPETRDFTTNYRTSYVPFALSVCPVACLPPYPCPSWPREHTFWDPVAKKWSIEVV